MVCISDKWFIKHKVYSYIVNIHFVVPSAPIIKNLEVLDSESIHVEWNIPTDTNGILTTYTISYSNENNSVMSFIVPFNGQNVRYSYITW